ncbi:MAG: hypothetical protein WA902_22950 [Thermosynechococcaceae cyanobacterium]
MTQAADTDIRNMMISIDQRLEAISVDVVEIKISQATTNERLKGLDQRVGNLEDRLKTQDNRFWSLTIGIVLALMGLLAKLAFVPAV